MAIISRTLESVQQSGATVLASFLAVGGQKVQQDGEVKREQAKASGEPQTVVQLDSDGAVEMVARSMCLRGSSNGNLF